MTENDNLALVDHDLSVATVKLSKDLRLAAAEMGPDEARFLADMFETRQRERIRNGNRLIALEKAGEPIGLISHFQSIDMEMERQLGAALKKFTENQPLGQWMVDQKGVGPLIAARLLAFVDWEGSNTPSRIWRFAGLVPNLVWEKGQLRPWNARLKRVCYLLGESFIKSKGREGAYYGEHFTRKKRELWHKNASGGNKERALVLREKVGKTTEAYRWYNGDVTSEAAMMVARGTWAAGKKPWTTEPGAGLPMLPPGQIHAQARRWAAKLFLAHAWEVCWRLDPKRMEDPPEPYAIVHLGHKDIIAAPPGGPYQP